MAASPVPAAAMMPSERLVAPSATIPPAIAASIPVSSPRSATSPPSSHAIPITMMPSIAHSAITSRR